jgi:hypothetical protein
MKRAATTLAVSLAISVVVVACASLQPGGRDLVAKAVQAQGGAEALTSVKTLSEKVTVRQWEPEQSAVAGGEMRFANEGTVEAVTDVGSGATRSDWVRNFHYPAPRTYVLDPNPHAEGLLIGYIPDARLGFVTDIWSPGAAPLPDKLNPALAALVAGVKKAGISPAKFAGGHGGTADYAPLAALEGK